MLKTLLGSDLINWRDNRREQVLTLMAVSLITFLALCAYLTAKCVHSFVQATTAQVQVQVFWDPATELSTVQKQWETLSSRADVVSIQRFTPTKALTRVKETLGRDVDLSWLETNPLPPTLVLDVRPGRNSALPDFLEYLRSLPGVSKVHTNPLQAGLAASWSRITATVVWPLIVVLFCVQGLLLANIVRLTLSNMQEEIEVLQLIGATPWTYQSPILARTLVLSLGAASLGLLGLKVVHLRVSNVLSAPPLHLSCPFLSWSEIGGSIFLVSAVTCISTWVAIQVGSEQ